MKNITLENLTKVCGGVYSGPSDKLEQEVSSITTDSRKAEAGTLFVPIVGCLNFCPCHLQDFHCNFSV